MTKVVLNYDNLKSAGRYFGPNTIIIPNDGNTSRDPCYMADTVYLRKRGRTEDEVLKIAKGPRRLQQKSSLRMNMQTTATI